MYFFLFLTGDVALTRGIDQILKYKNNPVLYESSIKDARDYIPSNLKYLSKPGRYVDWYYIWGDLLKNELYQNASLRIINLETSITTSLIPFDYNKPVLYKMHPGNIPALQAARIDFASSANNHILDWSMNGLMDTITTLSKAGIAHGGAGYNLAGAKEPVVFQGRKVPFSVLIFSIGDVSSGIPIAWKATKHSPGVNVIDITDSKQAKQYVDYVRKTVAATATRPLVIVSIHIMSNWGWEIPVVVQKFFHDLIDYGGVDLIAAHSSHHFRPIEIYKDKLILYGMGDALNDYTIITSSPGKDKYLSWANLAYFPFYDVQSMFNNQSQYKLKRLIICGYTIKNFQLKELSFKEMELVWKVMNIICAPFGLKFNKSREYNCIYI